ncbi:DUF1800 family protein [bacterium]|nr:DUF1800 family protein [bacterium]
MVCSFNNIWRSLLLITGLTISLGSDAADVDLDGNGLDDVWELLYNAGGLVADDDADGDGDSNVMEEEAGTNPLDRDSKLRVGNVDLSGSDATVTFAAQAGKRYKLLGGAISDGTDFTELGTLDAISEAGEISVTGLAAGVRFFQISAEDLDSDNDGIRDWSELQLDGYEPDSANSRDPFINDRGFLIQMLNAETGAFQMTVIEAEGFENGGGGAPTPLKVRISRTGGVSPVTLFYTAAGSTDPAKEPAVEADYAALSGMVAFANGETAHDVEIVPTVDGIYEFPNSLIFSLDPHTDYDLGIEMSGELTIFDATNDPENQVNFVGQMRPERNSETSASGYGFIKLNGKRDTALVTMRFSGLTTTQIAAHIHQSTIAGDGINITNGPVVESLPLGQMTDYVWNIRRTGANSAQNLIDALAGQNGRPPLYCNAHSMQNPGGEIWAFFGKTNGSTEFEVPDAPPAIEPLTGDDLTRDVQRFLTQATFGAREGEIQALVDDINNNHGGDRMAGYEAWIDAQYALDQTRLYDLAYFADQMEWDRLGLDPANLVNNPPQPRQSNRQGGFYAIAMNAHDQLRQRVAFALSEILVISELEGIVNSRHYGTAKYYDMLGNHTDGHFLQILRDVSKSPMMGQYLSSLKNSKATLDGQGNVIIAPDENYAREIMQLFSIGLLELHPDGSLILDENGLPSQTYTNDGITELARVFTGWSFGKRNGAKNSGYPVENNTNYFQGGGPLYFQASWENLMKNFADYHDQNAKTIFGQTLAAGRNGYQDLNDATSILDSHPNTGPFIARLMIQRLVTSNPSAGYIYRVGKVMSDNDGGTGGQMKKVVTAILLDYEARSLTNVEKVGYGKQKEPMLRYLQLMRALDSKSQLSLDMLNEHGYPAGQRNNFPADATMLRWTTHLHSWFSQSHLRAPTVFNWFLPDQQVGGPLQEAGLVAPEFTATNEYQVIRWVNYARNLIVSTNGFGARELPNQRTDEALNDPTGLLDNIKNDHTITAYVTMLNDYIANGDTEEIATEKILDQLDLRLTGGRMKVKYGSDTTGDNPRNAILAQATYVYDPGSSSSHIWTIRDIFYLLSTSPEFITQK